MHAVSDRDPDAEAEADASDAYNDEGGPQPSREFGSRMAEYAREVRKRRPRPVVVEQTPPRRRIRRMLRYRTLRYPEGLSAPRVGGAIYRLDHIRPRYLRTTSWDRSNSDD